LGRIWEEPLKTAATLTTPRQPVSQTAADEIFARAERAFAKSDYATASPLYSSLLEKGVSPGLMLYRLAMIANYVEKYDTAYEFHCEAIKADPHLAHIITSQEFAHYNVLCRAKYDTEEIPFCPICGSAKQKPMMVVNSLPLAYYHPAYHPIRRLVQCEECGHGWANPRPTLTAMLEASADPPPGHLMGFSYEQMTVKSDILHELWARKPGGDLLDIGTANGTTASVAQDFGYRVTAMDIHSGYADLVRGMGIEFIEADITNCNLGNRTFDVIMMGDVIEHVVDVKGTIANVKALLKPGGLFWLSTPNYEGAWTRAVKSADAMWMEGEHIHSFSLRSLKRLMHDCGLTVTDYRLSKRYVGCAEIIVEKTKNTS
jgi:2-polyprenyl-3-methyl-5-hydroxy-6-metoxy-1,4-benzoquinol methylase